MPSNISISKKKDESDKKAFDNMFSIAHLYNLAPSDLS
jgi:hypothetical protein